jgi:hypothetical protein
MNPTDDEALWDQAMQIADLFGMPEEPETEDEK